MIYRTVLLGVGAVGRHFLQLLQDKEEVLERRYRLRPVVVAALDSSGGLMNARGLSPALLREHKMHGGKLAHLPGGIPGLTVPEVLARMGADVLIDASPVDLRTGEPGLSAVRTALSRGIDVVLANKAPLVLAYGELHALAERRRNGLAFSATVCGGLPVINMGQRDLVAARVHQFRGILNSTTNYILERMGEGYSYDEALQEAQRRGIAEADPRLDVEGWDTANKLVIIANAVLGVQATLKDVQRVEGITGLAREEVQEARRAGTPIKLVAEAVLQKEGTYALCVAPVRVPETDFLAHVRGWEMGVVFETDIYEVISAKIDERGPMATAAAVLRDVVMLARARAR